MAAAATMRDFTGDVIKIKVGPLRIVFSVHENLLRTKSELIDTTLKVKKESNSEDLDASAIGQDLELPKMDAADFSRFVEWLYSRQIAYEKDVDAAYDTLSKIYIMGENLLATDFQNAIADAFLVIGYKKNKWPSLKIINTIYDGTPCDSPARKLMIHIWAYCATTEWVLAQKIKDAHSGFLIDLVPLLLKVRAAPSAQRTYTSGKALPRALSFEEAMGCQEFHKPT